MFKEARVKLTIYYLTIIMVISLFFSAIIYQAAVFELNRIENRQKVMRANPAFLIDPDIIDETKSRIFISLLTLNTIILGVSGVSGYFLAGKTLKPISKMMDEQKEFVGNASHELRTPLASLKSEIEVSLRDPKLKLSDVKKLLLSNLEDVNNMTRLSNYLLKLNKFENGDTKSEFKNINLAEIVKNVVGKKDIKLSLEKTIVKGDYDSLTELVNILIDNAVKYGNGKEIEIEVKKSRVLIVKDHGIGIAKEDMHHIFDRFFRGDKARSKDGYGLGLSIAKQIVNLHSASIKVSSKLGSGSIFKVIFS